MHFKTIILSNFSIDDNIGDVFDIASSIYALNTCQMDAFFSHRLFNILSTFINTSCVEDGVSVGNIY